jgi:hypothetical protein
MLDSKQLNTDSRTSGTSHPQIQQAANVDEMTIDFPHIQQQCDEPVL